MAEKPFDELRELREVVDGRFIQGIPNTDLRGVPTPEELLEAEQSTERRNADNMDRVMIDLQNMLKERQ